MVGFDRRAGVRWGLIAALVVVFTAAIGMVETFDKSRMIISISPTKGISMGFLALLWSIPVISFKATVVLELEGVEAPPKGMGNVLTGGVVGLLAGIGTGAFTWLVHTYDLRDAFVKLSPVLVRILTFNRVEFDALFSGVLIMTVLMVVLGLAGGAMHLISAKLRKQIVAAWVWIVVVALFETVFSQIMREGLFFLVPEDIFLSVTDRSLVTTVYNDGGLTWGAALLVATIAFWAAGRTDVDRGARMLGRLRSPDPTVRTRWSLTYGAIVLLVIVFAPVVLGSLLSELLANVGLFLLMGLGLNVVVGLAGMLDLGYVAFFAVGAYTIGVMTSPQFGFGWSWWAAFPVAIIMSAIAGILVGTPVIRMRGDYLAIVTLGFGEIVRILFLSDWLKPAFGGAQGITQIPAIDLGFTEVSGISPQKIIYFVVAFVLIAIWVSYAVQQSRVGRAWTAIREDETVAEVMGINTVGAKLSAFVVGAILAGMGGALFSAKVGSIFPSSFKLLVSIIILVVVIVGGMGSIRGVIVGALVLIGVLGGPTQPGLLQEFAEFKLLVVGVLLIFMMLKRPEGLVPSVRRSRELHHEELTQDAWLAKAGDFTGEGGEGEES